MARVTRLARVSLPLALSAALAASCAPARYVLPGASGADDARNDAACTYEALTTPPPYQSGLPWHGYGGRYAGGKGIGMLIVLLLDRASTAAWRDGVRERCLVAMGYEEVR